MKTLTAFLLFAIYLPTAGAKALLEPAKDHSGSHERHSGASEAMALEVWPEFKRLCSMRREIDANVANILGNDNDWSGVQNWIIEQLLKKESGAASAVPMQIITDNPPAGPRRMGASAAQVSFVYNRAPVTVQFAKLEAPAKGFYVTEISYLNRLCWL